MDTSHKNELSTPSPLTTRQNLLLRYFTLSQSGKVSGMFLAFGISLLLVALVALIFGQRIGYNQGVSYANEKTKTTPDGEKITSEKFQSLKMKVKTLENQLITTQQERDISLANLEDLRKAEQQLKITNLQMQQNNDIFTEILAKQGGIPLQIIGAQIAPLPENAYEYRFDVAMLDESNQAKKLIPKLLLLDEINMVEVPLEPKSYDVHGIARVRGRFLMPQGFNPKQAKVELTVGEQTIEQIYNWQLGKPIDNMPYSLEETPDKDQRPLPADPATQSIPKKSDDDEKKDTESQKTN